ncbi:MAG: (Fe-S)-binding protein [Candidatus Brockarchaeota archaeon]|nr:(Fe-S)-binding protein [Candidatus Brockarchaeota archaeon]
MLIENYKAQIYSCGRCGYCVGAYLDHVCPSRFIAGFESATGRGRMLIARAILEGRLAYSKELTSALFTCFLCGACDVKCELAAKIKITEITKAMRTDAFNSGIQLEKLSPIAKALAEQHNIYNETREAITLFNSDTESTERADMLYFPGCITTYRYPKIAESIKKILNLAGVTFTVLVKDEWCCGNPLLSMGIEGLAREIATHNVEKIKQKGVKTVLTSCPGCYRTISQDYPKILGEELTFKVVHTTQFLDELILKGYVKFRKASIGKVTYHDPCEIGRYFKIYAEPRNIIQSIPDLDFTEMRRNKEDSWCCGGGGSVNVVHTYGALKVAGSRIKEARETGTKTLVTACPSCVQMLKLASKREKAGIMVIDISELVSSVIKAT